MAKAFTHNPLYVSEKRHTGEAVKAKNENLLTRARESVHFLHADATFLIVVGKRISKAKKIIFGFALFCFVVTIYFHIFAKT